MDIAKIRKKYKDSVQEGPKDVGAKPGGEPGEEGTFQRKPDIQESTKTAVAVERRGEGAPEETVDSVVELLTFTLSKEEYAFRIEDVHEIIRPQRITKIPKTKAYLLGITSMRGKIIPVIDMKKLLSLEKESAEGTSKQKIVILKGPEGQIGALIDRVVGVSRPSVSRIVESPAHLRERETKFIEGVAIMEGRFISILKIEEVIAL